MQTCSDVANPSTGFVSGELVPLFHEIDFDTLDAEPSDRLWYRIPADETPDGDTPDAGRTLESSGRQNWTKWQREKQPIAEGLDAIGKPEQALALRNCGTFLVVHHFEGGRVVQALNECRQRCCTGAMRARSKTLLASTFAGLSKFLDKNSGLQGVMVTLTIKNCASHELKITIDKMLHAFGEMTQRADMKRAVRGWIRVLELTYNAVTKEWHPHIHAVLFVERAAYFKPNSRIYITQEKLATLWQKQLRLDYVPNVDIRPMRGVSSPLGDEGRKSLQEILKYVLKPGTLIEYRDGKPCLVGAESVELYDAGDGQGLREMRCVPLRAVCDALKSRRLVATSRNLQNEAELDFADDPKAASLAKFANLGRYLCTEFYGWRVRGTKGDYFLLARTFNDPTTTGGYAMGP